MSKGIETLKARPGRRTPALAAGQLYRWLQTHQADIRRARDAGAGWAEILHAAQEDNIPLREDANARRVLQKTWARVCRAEEKFVSAQAKSMVARSEATEAAPPRIMPSRLPRDWRPEFVDSPSNGERSGDVLGSSSREEAHTPRAPVPTITGDREKKALTPTNPHSVASSDGEMSPALPEEKTLADLALEKLTRDMKIEANRKAGYFGDK